MAVAINGSGSISGFGCILQVVQATFATNTLVTGTAWTDTIITASITPKASTSRILVMVTTPVIIDSATLSIVYAGHRLLRGSTAIWRDDQAALGGALPSGSPAYRLLDSMMYVDSPATTSATTYKTQARVNSTVSNININNSGSASIILMEVAA